MTTSPFEAYLRAAEHAQQARDGISNLPPQTPLPEPGADRTDYMARTDATEMVMLHSMLATAGAAGLQSAGTHLRGQWQNTVSTPDED